MPRARRARPCADLLVRLQHDPAALAHPVDADAVLVGGRQHRLHRARPFDRRDLDPVLPAVGETLARSGKVVGVAGRKVEGFQDVGGRSHAQSPNAGTPWYRQRCLLPLGDHMTMLVLLIVLGLTPLPRIPPQEERPRVPKDSIELVITGCLKGRLLIVSDLRQTDTQAGPIVRAKTFRLAGKGDVMKIVKKEDRHLVDVIGIVKKSALIEPGVKVGKGSRDQRRFADRRLRHAARSRPL